MARKAEIEQKPETPKSGPERPMPLPLAERRRLVQPVTRPPEEPKGFYTDWAMI